MHQRCPHLGPPGILTSCGPPQLSQCEKPAGHGLPHVATRRLEGTSYYSRMTWNRDVVVYTKT